MELNSLPSLDTSLTATQSWMFVVRALLTYIMTIWTNTQILAVDFDNVVVRMGHVDNWKCTGRCCNSSLSRIEFLCILTHSLNCSDSEWTNKNWMPITSGWGRDDLLLFTPFMRRVEDDSRKRKWINDKK